MLFPLFLDLTDRLVVVIGGGPVGRRKMKAVRAAGARVRLVCLEPQPVADANAVLEWRNEPYRPEHLEGAALVFAAATPEVNRHVVADARSRGLWVNAASTPAMGDFQMPALIRRGQFVVAVSTSGAAPSLARSICRRLETEFDEAFSAWIALLAELRPLILTRITDPAQRRHVLEQLAHGDWLERLRREGVAAVRNAMQSLVLGD